MVYCSYCSLSAEKPTLNSQSFIDIQGNYILAKVPGSYSPKFIFRYLLLPLLPNAPPKA
jgi:hypothetical protein